MLMRRRLSAVLTLALLLAGFTTATAPAEVSAAPSSAVIAKTTGSVAIGKHKNRSVAAGKKVTIKPKVSTSGKVKVSSKTLTVKKGSKTVAKKRKSVKLATGTYKVTTTVKYKTKSGTTWSKTKTKSKTQTLKITKKKAVAGPAKPNASGECPASAPIKGNQGKPDWIYHKPGGAYYKRTHAEECFTTEAAAKNAGYRASKR